MSLGDALRGVKYALTLVELAAHHQAAVKAHAKAPPGSCHGDYIAKLDAYIKKRQAEIVASMLPTKPSAAAAVAAATGPASGSKRKSDAGREEKGAPSRKRPRADKLVLPDGLPVVGVMQEVTYRYSRGRFRFWANYADNVEVEMPTLRISLVELQRVQKECGEDDLTSALEMHIESHID